MTLSTRHEGPVTIVRVQGRLALGPDLRDFKGRIDKELSSSTGLVLNLAGVSEVDSSGLGELVAIHVSTSRRGVRMALAEVNTRIREILAITRTDGLFAVCVDEPSALEHVAQPKVSDQP